MNGRSATEQSLELSAFVPFRLNRLAGSVSQYLAGICRERFGLDMPQWRVMAIVGGDACTAQSIAARTRMHKTRVSRAIAELEARNLIERAAAGPDRRERQVRLTKAGQRMYGELVPLALERERSLLACLDPEQYQGFLTGLVALEGFLRLDAQP